MTPDTVALDYWLKPLAPESMPQVAAWLLADGYDSPALREVAGMPSTDPVGIRETFVQALRDLGSYPETRREAELRVARSLCRDAVMGQLQTFQLAGAIRDLWDFDEVTYHALPPLADDLAVMCWFYETDLFEENGGGERLNRAIAVMASG